MSHFPWRRRLGVVLVLLMTTLGAAGARAADPPKLDLDHLSATEAEQLLRDGKITSVQLTQAYIDRIQALNKSGPGLNAVTQFNRRALVEAARTDDLRARGVDLGPAMGLPILLKDIIDATPMYTSAGNFSLRNSFPAQDSGVAARLRENGVVVLGKLGLSEFANFFGNQPSGFSNLTGQVLNALDADQNPSGSSSGSGSAAAAALAPLTIGTETSGSIISPSSTQGIVGLRPTVGLVPGYGIAPIYASQDTAGPMERTVSDAAMTMQSLVGPAGSDPTADDEAKQADEEYKTVFGDDYVAQGIVPRPPTTAPDYLSALNTDFVKGKRIGYVGPLADGSAQKQAVEALEDAGADVVQANAQVTGTVPSAGSCTTSTGATASCTNWEAHKTIDAYYAHLGDDAPIKSMDEEVQDNLAHPLEALKFGNATHAGVQQTDLSAANASTYRTALAARKAVWHQSLDDILDNGTPNDPSDDLDALVGAPTRTSTVTGATCTSTSDPTCVTNSLSNTPQAGYPQTTVPMGYVAATRRANYVYVYGGPYTERTLIGTSYAIEQATKLRQAPADVNPSMYRCARTATPEPFAARGDCNPDHKAIMDVVGSRPDLPFSLEDETAASLQARETAGTLSAETLTKAYLSRIALANANGPALQAVRKVDAAAAIARAKALDAERADGDVRGPLHGIPVLVDDSIDAKGFPTTAGSIALQGTKPARDSKLVSRLKAAGAIVLGKTNVTELNGVFDANLPEGYSSLGGQVLMPFDTDKTPAGSSAGSAAATSAGLAALTVGLETSPDSAQLIAPASVAGDVGLKPTVGRVSRTGVLGVARSQDSPGPIGRSVTDVADALQVIGVRDTDDDATAGAPAPGTPGTDYTSGLKATALSGKSIGVVATTGSTPAAYTSAIAAVQGAGATTSTKTTTAPSLPPSIIAREFKRDLNAYLAATPGGASSLAGVIAYNADHPVEGLKYQQGELTAAQATDTDGSYESDRDTGRQQARAFIDGLLSDVEAVMVPVGDPLLAVADRAGYPVLTVPAGYGATASGSGHDPVGVAFVGTRWSEATLLADGYAFEQATKVRVAPSQYNPSMWRCVPGSTYFRPYKCNPGDLQYTATFDAVPVTPTPTPTASPTAAPTATPTPTATPKPPTGNGGDVFTKARQRAALSGRVGKRLGRSLTVTDRFLKAGTVRYALRLKGRPIGTATRTVTAGRRTTRVTTTRRGRKRLARYPKARVTLRTRFAGVQTARTVKRT